MAALTTPTPVMTTPFATLASSRAPEEQGDVLPAEAERVGDGALDGRFAGDARARSRSATSGSGVTRLAVGGSRSCTSARIVATASRLPAAAIVWPIIDLVELTSTPPSPNTRAIAWASMRSFCGVAVPCALT